MQPRTTSSRRSRDNRATLLNAAAIPRATNDVLPARFAGNERRVSPAAHTFDVRGALAVSGLSRSSLYRALAAGQIEAVKHGRRLLILGDSLRAFLAGLPKAAFRPQVDAP